MAVIRGSSFGTRLLRRRGQSLDSASQSLLEGSTWTVTYRLHDKASIVLVTSLLRLVLDIVETRSDLFDRMTIVHLLVMIVGV